MVAAPPQPRRIELILREIDTLPTLPAVATRLLTLTTDASASADEVVQLIQADGPLTAKVLSLCRGADKGMKQVDTVAKAVGLLGFTAIRNAVLSVKVMEFFAEGTGDQGSGIRSEGNADPAQRERSSLNPDPPSPIPALDRRGLWLHSVAVATLAEAIARAHKAADLPADEAFVCGLLHDVGKLALDHVLPRGYGRVVELTEVHRRNVAEFERKIIGLDHHTAGKRLAEQWGLPLRLQDCIWLHGSPLRTVPDVPHRRMVGLIRLADLLARRQHVGYSGNHSLHEDADELAATLGLNPAKVAAASAGLFQQLEERGRTLGVGDAPSDALRLAAMQRANAELGALNTTLDARSRQAASQARVLYTVTAFHAGAAPAASLGDVLDRVAASAVSFLGEGPLTLLVPSRAADDPEPWRCSRYRADGRPLSSDEFDPPGDPEALAAAEPDALCGAAAAMHLPRLPPHPLGVGINPPRLVPLPSGWGTAAYLVHHHADPPAWKVLQPLAATWGAAVAAARQHAGARHLGEQLAELNAALADAQDRAAASESLARLGEMAAGAAHEMNNPLSVIAGRSQLLTLTLPEASRDRAAALAIFREAHRLSDLITSLRMFADPPVADRKPTDLAAVVQGVVDKVRKSLEKQDRPFTVTLDAAPLPAASLDAEQVQRALTELLFNAVQAEPKSLITVSLRHVAAEHLALLRITDDASGMDSETLRHAFDPFFSARPAGRQLGMGLPRARQLARAHGGDVTLTSTPGRGTEATLTLALDSPHAPPDESS